MTSENLTFELVAMRHGSRRAVGFLTGDPQLSAKQAFDSLSDKDHGTLVSRMEYWASGKDSPKEWFHGFDDPAYRYIFQFRLRDDRYYGFLCNPKPVSQPDFRLCVLCIDAAKHTKATDETIKKHVEQWRTNKRSRIAIAKEYPEYGHSATQGKKG